MACCSVRQTSRSSVTGTRKPTVASTSKIWPRVDHYHDRPDSRSLPGPISCSRGIATVRQNSANRAEPPIRRVGIKRHVDTKLQEHSQLKILQKHKHVAVGKVAVLNERLSSNAGMISITVAGRFRGLLRPLLLHLFLFR